MLLASQFQHENKLKSSHWSVDSSHRTRERKGKEGGGREQLTESWKLARLLLRKVNQRLLNPIIRAIREKSVINLCFANDVWKGLRASCRKVTCSRWLKPKPMGWRELLPNRLRKGRQMLPVGPFSPRNGCIWEGVGEGITGWLCWSATPPIIPAWEQEQTQSERSWGLKSMP